MRGVGGGGWGQGVGQRGHTSKNRNNQDISHEHNS